MGAATSGTKTESRYWHNGVESGELAQVAAIAGHYGVPPIMVTGDEATCREARQFFGVSRIEIRHRDLGRGQNRAGSRTAGPTAPLTSSPEPTQLPQNIGTSCPVCPRRTQALPNHRW
jgi:hypothetical protein